MKKHFRGAAIGFFLITVVLVTTAFQGRYSYVEKKLLAIESLLNTYYVGEVDENKLQEGIYKGFVSGVGDLYTSYYTAEEYSTLKEKNSGTYVGIGIQMTLESYDNSVVIMDVFEGSPAEEAGLLVEDKIIKAAGKSINGDDYSILPSLVKGTEGTTVDITVYRPSEDKTIDFTVARKSVSAPTVNFKMLDDTLGYINITNFEEVTYDQFVEALSELQQADAKGLVLDLRNNPGGLLPIVKNIADELVPKGVIVSTKDKNGEGETYYSDDKYLDLPMVCLINGNSASASEVLAGALKDYGRAKLIGTTTYGKGLVQTIIPFRDGSAIKLTTAQYYIPSGVCIQGIGIDPDVEVKLSIEETLKGSRLDVSEDTQLQKAMEVLKSEITQG